VSKLVVVTLSHPHTLSTGFRDVTRRVAYLHTDSVELKYIWMNYCRFLRSFTENYDLYYISLQKHEEFFWNVTI
jgi:hypothetical protein